MENQDVVIRLLKYCVLAYLLEYEKDDIKNTMKQKSLYSRAAVLEKFLIKDYINLVKNYDEKFFLNKIKEV